MPPESYAPSEKPLHKMMVPGAILLAGILLAAGVYEYRAPIKLSLFGSDTSGTLATFNPPSPSDHIFGNPNAPIKVIEYCDLDTPYCKQFQSVMDAIMTTYGPSGQVAWIYRQFPIQDADANSLKNAAAAECAGVAGGDAGFFAFLDAVAKAAPGSQEFDTSTAAQVAAAAGIPTNAFANCMSSGNEDKAVAGDYQTAVTAGATGAPYIILVTDGKTPNVLTGALSYDAMQSVIDAARAADGLD